MTTDSLPQPQCAFGQVEEEVAGAEQVFKQHDAKLAVLCAACLVFNAAQRWLLLLHRHSCVRSCMWPMEESVPLLNFPHLLSCLPCC